MAIAKTTFVSGSDESLAAVDAYAAPPQTPVSEATSVGSARLLTVDEPIVNPAQALDTVIKGLQGGAVGFLSSGESIQAGITVLSQLLDKPEKFFNDVKGNLIKDMVTSVGYGKQAEDLAKMITGEKGALSPLDFLAKNNPKMRIIMGGIETVRSAKDITDVSSLLKVVGDLSGNTELGQVLNIGPQMSVVKSLVGKSIELGLPELTSNIIDLVHGDYEKMLVKLYSVPLAAESGDSEFIDEVMQEYSPEQITGMSPEIVSDILSNYKFPSPTTKTVDQLAGELEARCTLLDPMWHTDMRDGVSVYSIKNMTNISPDAKTALMRLPEHMSGAMVAEEYTESSLLVISQINYPFMPVL